MMKIPIETIQIGSRIRTACGDLEDLKQSILRVGLLEPVLITESMKLISGYRRLMACRELGWTDVEAIIVQTEGDPLRELEMEYHENLGRIDLSDADRQNYQLKQDQLQSRPSTNFLLTLLKRLRTFLSRLFNLLFRRS